MPNRILVNGEWYEPVRTESLYELDYENAILANATALFPGFRCVRFKAHVDSEFGGAKADLALIDLQYRTWFVVEVELDTHPLRAHVEAQVRRLSRGRYTADHARRIGMAAPDLDEGYLAEMLMGDQPQVLVIVTRERPNWASALLQFGARMSVVEMFRGDIDRVVLSVDSEIPSLMPDEFVSLCTRDSMMANALRLGSPASFAGLDDVEILVNGASTKWKVVRVSDAAWLMPSGRFPLAIESGGELTICRHSSGNFAIDNAILNGASDGD